MFTISERLKDEGELYQKIIESALFNMRVAAPGIIKSFDANSQTVTVQIAIREQININGDLKWMEIPLLVDVPIMIPRAGGFCLTLPIKVGDECLVVFGDRQIDHWWESGGVQNQSDIRVHDLSDGFALIGVWSQPNKISSYSTDKAQLRSDDGTVHLDITSSGINIVGPVTIDGKKFLDHTHGPGTFTAGSNAVTGVSGKVS